MAYNKVGWKNYPDKTTKMSAENFEHMDAQIKENADNIGDIDKIADIGDGTIAGAVKSVNETKFSMATTLANLVSGEKLSVSFGKIAKAIADLISHIGSKANPHAVTKSQVGLGNVDNTADSAKSVKYAASAGSANSVAWGNVSGKPSTFAPSAHGNHVPNKPAGIPTNGNLYLNYNNTWQPVTAAQVGALPTIGGILTGDVTMSGSTLLKFKSDADLQAESYVYVASGGASCGMEQAGTYKFTSESFIPAKNDSQRLGSSNYKWKQLYASTTTISTSDRNLKKDIKELTEKHKEFFMKLVPVSFGFVDGESGRTHIGFISQDVEQSMKELGMTSLDFAGFCKDVKIKIETTYEDILDEYGDKILDEKGKPKQNRIEKEVQVLDENGNPEYIYSLRYEEFIGIIAYVLQETIYELQDTKKDITELKSKLASIENTITKISA